MAHKRQISSFKVQVAPEVIKEKERLAELNSRPLRANFNPKCYSELDSKRRVN